MYCTEWSVPPGRSWAGGVGRERGGVGHARASSVPRPPSARRRRERSTDQQTNPSSAQAATSRGRSKTDAAHRNMLYKSFARQHTILTMARAEGRWLAIWKGLGWLAKGRFVGRGDAHGRRGLRTAGALRPPFPTSPQTPKPSSSTTRFRHHSPDINGLSGRDLLKAPPAS